MDPEILNPQVTRHGAKREPTTRVRLWIIVGKNLPSITVITYGSARRNELDRLRYIWRKKKFLRRQIMFRTKRPILLLANVTSKTRRFVRVATLPHIIAPQLIVIGKFSVTRLAEEVVRAPRITRQPETIQIAYPIIGSASRNHGRLVRNEHRSTQLCFKPNCATTRHIDLK